MLTVPATAVAATTIVPDPLDVPGLDQVCGVMGSGTVAGLLQLQGHGLKLGQSFNSVKLWVTGCGATGVLDR